MREVRGRASVVQEARSLRSTCNSRAVRLQRFREVTRRSADKRHYVNSRQEIRKTAFCPSPSGSPLRTARERSAGPVSPSRWSTTSAKAGRPTTTCSTSSTDTLRCLSHPFVSSVNARNVRTSLTRPRVPGREPRARRRTTRSARRAPGHQTVKIGHGHQLVPPTCPGRVPNVQYAGYVTTTPS